MALVVQKFGGATLANIEKIGQVADRIAEQKKTGDDLVVVVSAMGKTTDQLLAMARRLTITHL